MIRQIAATAVLGLALGLGACGPADTGQVAEEGVVDSKPPTVSFVPDGEFSVAGKPGGPVRFAYRIIGTPVVGQPVTVDVQVTSNVGDRPVTLRYQTTDTTAMSFPESQAASLTVALDDERPVAQQVTVIPLREGRLYLNVAAEIEIEGGSVSTVTAIPIEVGSKPRELEENGTVTTDEEGELVRSMSGSED